MSEEVRKVTFDQGLGDEQVFARKRSRKIFEAKGIVNVAETICTH